MQSESRSLQESHRGQHGTRAKAAVIVLGLALSGILGITSPLWANGGGGGYGGNNWTVCPSAGPSSPYSDIQEAIKNGKNETSIGAAVSAAKSGDQIEVCPGTYQEQVVVNGKRLTILGPSVNPNGGGWGRGSGGGGSQDFPSGQAIIMPGAGMAANANDFDTGQPIAAVFLVQNTQGVLLQNLTIDSSGNNVDACATGALGTPSGNVVGIVYQNAAGQILGNQVQHTNPGVNNNGACTSGFAIFTQANNAAPINGQVQIQNNSVWDFSEQGITANDFPTQAQIGGNVVTGNGPDAILQNGIQVAFNAAAQISQNTVVNDVYTACASASSCFSSGYAASGILLASTGSKGVSNLQVQNNVTGVSNVPLFLDEVANVQVQQNTVYQSVVLDGIDVFGSFTNRNNQIQNNNISNSARYAINIVGQNNQVNGNLINGAAVGINTSSFSGNQIGGQNQFFNTAISTQDPPAQSVQPLVRQ